MVVDNKTNSSKLESLDPVAIDFSKEAPGTGSQVKMDLNEDAWDSAAPVYPGRYALKLFADKDGVKKGQENKNDPTSVYYNIGLECKVVSDDKETNGATIFANMSTRVYRRKNISTMVGLILKAGFKLPTDTLTAYDQVKLFLQVLKREPIVECELDWSAGYKNPDGSWENVYSTYEEFPTDLDNPKVKDWNPTVTTKSGGKASIRAMVKPKHWYAKGEESIKKAAAVGAPGGGAQQTLQFASRAAVEAPLAPSPHVAPPPAPVAPPAPPVVAVAPTPPVAPAVAQTVQDDLDLLLG